MLKEHRNSVLIISVLAVVLIIAVLWLIGFLYPPDGLGGPFGGGD
jgi:hypothetical protein